MSLDVYLIHGATITHRFCGHCGGTHECQERVYLYEANITHNLNAMAKEAEIYNHLWRPDEIGIKKAEQLIEPLRDGIKLMKSDPLRFMKHDAKNGWGTYEQFVPWVERYLAACEEHPYAQVEAHR